ncbi:hypothetical protein [Roseateles amylovorans]|uniref:Restriction endonuclease type IV Mrr domain-containing protein n=1 Tax=Roseateles amylovorans TaxID=2978473 RepID=A0ABY6AXJ1_9BURK|nr:hypothetical protein [Roseateles amylovorans]UXH77911.1 hypothetical protein N4261_23565 [Roseateles amylovorans]
MSLHNSLPQEWPDYLHDDAEVQPALTVPPAGRYVLDFASLQPLGFEQFCWWLLRKHRRLVGCKRLGGPGLAQGGIDLFAFDDVAPDQLVVFECKSGEGFSASSLTKAMEKFDEGSWKSSTREFYLVLAKYEIEPPLAERWRQVKRDLREKGIHGALWTAHTLTAMVQEHPDVLSKFFPTYPIEHFGNKWMQRVGFHEAFNKAFFDPREHVRAQAFALAQQGELEMSAPADAPLNEPSTDASLPILEPESSKEFKRIGYNWSYRGPWFSISAILPGPQFNHPSAAIDFNIANLTGLTLALGGRWLHDKMLFATGSPITHEHRGFVVGPVPGLEGLVIDLSSARLRLPDDVVEELASVADALTDAVQDAYLELESRWGSAGFPFVNWSGNRVVLGAIDRRGWHEIIAFARAHDVSAGDQPWCMFDAAQDVLKPYVIQTERHSGRFDLGYHGIFYASADVEIDLAEGHLAIMWQPPDAHSNEELSERGWWPVEFAHRWLDDELLPEVRRWVLQREFPSWIGRLARRNALSRFQGILEACIDLRDLRRPSLLDEDRLVVPTRGAVERMQSFFSAAHNRPHAFVSAPVVETLFAALAMLTRLQYGHVRYVVGSLSLAGAPKTHAELEMAILARVREHKVVPSTSGIDYALRAFLELLPADDTLVPRAMDDVLRAALVPLARVHDAAQLARRHEPPTQR